MVVAPSATPPAIVSKLNAELRDIVADPVVVEEWAKRGVVAQSSAPPAELAAFVKSEIVRLGAVVLRAGAAGIE